MARRVHDVRGGLLRPGLSHKPLRGILRLRAAAQRLRHRACHELPIGRVDQFQQPARGDRALLRPQPDDAVRLVGLGDAIGVEVMVSVADVRDALGLLQLGLAVSQAAKHQQSGERIAQPSADLLEEPLLLRRPDPSV